VLALHPHPNELPVAPSREGPSVATEIRVVAVPAGFCEKLAVGGKDGGATAFLGDEQVCQLLETVRGDRRASVMCAPKLSMLDGQPGTICVGEQRPVTTGVEVKLVDGKPVAVPKTEQVLVPGDCDPSAACAVKMTVCPTVSADRRHVRLAVGGQVTWRNGPGELIPVTHPVTPVFEGGSQGAPVPFTTHIEKPDLTTVKLDRTAAVPDGRTMVVLAGRRTVPAPGCSPVLAKIPYLNRLFVNASDCCEPPMTEQEVLVLVTPRIICQGDTQVAQAAATGPACGECCEKPCAEAAELVAAYREACAAGKTEQAMKLAMQALAKDPRCFAGSK
jgi:hypothetical protein